MIKLEQVERGIKCSFSFFLSFFWRNSPQGTRASSIKRFLDHTQRRTAVCRTPLDEWSARRRDLYLTKHYAHNRQTSMPPVGFEPTISAGERPQTYALDRAVTGMGTYYCIFYYSIVTYIVLLIQLSVSRSVLNACSQSFSVIRGTLRRVTSDYRNSAVCAYFRAVYVLIRSSMHQ